MPTRPAPESSDAQAEAVLTSLGLSRTERRTYLYLLQASSGHPTEVARETGQSRGRIYETLRSLVERGFVREEPSRPVRYLPVPFSEVVAVALSGAHRRIQRLKRLRTELDATPRTSQALVPRAVAVFTGRRAVVRETRRMLEEADRRFVLWGGGAVAERLAASPEFVAALKEAAGRGLHVELLLPDTPETANARNRIEPDVAALVRPYAPELAPTLGHVVTEQELLLVAVQPDDDSATRGDDVAVAAGGAPFADADLQWIRAAVGPTMASVPAAVGRDGEYPVADLDPERVGLQFLESLAGAHEEVLGMGPRGWGRFLERGWEATVGVYAAAKRRGVRFRALTTDAPQEREHMARFGALWEMRVTGWIPTWLIVVDGRELFQAFTTGAEGSAPELRHSTEPSEVRFYIDLFERLWQRGRPLAEEPVARREPGRR